MFLAVVAVLAQPFRPSHFHHHRHYHHHRCPPCDRGWGRVHRWHAPGTQAGVEQGASWYDDSGGTACGFHASDHGRLGVANKYLPCGTRVTLCSARCAVVEVEDRGPFIAGREWDLNEAARDAIGYPGDPAGVVVR